MTALPTPFNVMIAHAGHSPWAEGLARSLAPLPLELHRPKTADQTFDLAATRRMHVAVVDDDLPDAGGRGVVRRMRGAGLHLPCLLVCRMPDQRVLQDAMQLDVFTVVEADAQGELLPPVVLKLVRRIYRVEWTIPGGFDQANN
ncbi:MAG: hypothetical protein ACE5E1_06325 [Phycisphaerae bacterium]